MTNANEDSDGRGSRWSKHLAILGKTNPLLNSAAIAKTAWARSGRRASPTSACRCRNSEVSNVYQHPGSLP
jgi:hypothetical protein